MKRSFLSIIFLFFATNFFATIWYAKPTATGSGSGSSWANATTLKNAISLAVNGDEILCYSGTHKPGTLNTDFYNITKNITISGGYFGSTIISGDLGGSVFAHTIFKINGTVSINNVTIQNGEHTEANGGSGTGVIYAQSGTLTFNKCIITSNTSEISVVYADNNATVILNDCSVTSNDVGTPAIFCEGCIKMDANRTYFIDNTTIYNSWPGIAFGAINTTSTSTVRNCVFRANTSSFGSHAGLFYGTASVDIENCTFSGNPRGVRFDGIAGYTMNIRNSIIYNNTNGQINNDGAGTLNVVYSCVQGGYSGTGNISTNPLFVSGTDLHIQTTSPCKNTGNNTYAANPTDIDGGTRILSTTVDMGAYEFGCAAPSVPSGTSTPATLCAAGVVNLNVTSPTAGITYSWYSSSCGVSKIASGTSINAEVLSTPSTIYLRAENLCGNSTCANITINTGGSPPVPTYTPASPKICGSNSVEVTATGGGPNVVYQWYSSSCGGTLLGTSDSYTFTAGGTYYVRSYDASAPGGCQYSTCATITVVSEAQICDVKGFFANPSNNCGPNTITLAYLNSNPAPTTPTGCDNTGYTDATTYHYYKDGCGTENGGIHLGSGISVNPTVTTTEVFYIRREKAGFCPSPCKQATINVNPLPLNPAEVNASPTSVCSGGSSTLTVSGGSTGPDYEYVWYTGSCGGTEIDIGSSVVVSPGSTTTYYVAVRNFWTYCKSECLQVTVTVGSGNPVGIVTFTGNVNSNWHNCANWSPEVIPTSQSNVVIPNAKNAIIYNPNIADCNTIEIQGTGTLEIQTGSSLNAISQ